MVNEATRSASSVIDTTIATTAVNTCQEVGAALLVGHPARAAGDGHLTTVTAGVEVGVERTPASLLTIVTTVVQLN